MTDDLVKRGRLLAKRSIDGDLRGTALQMADRIEELQAERIKREAREEALRDMLGLTINHAPERDDIHAAITALIEKEGRDGKETC